VKAFMDYKERSTVWKTDHVLAVCGGIIRASGLEYIFTRKCPLPYIPRFETVAQEPIDQKLIAVRPQAFVALRIRRIQVAFEGLPDTADRKLLHRRLAERFAALPSRREKVDRF